MFPATAAAAAGGRNAPRPGNDTADLMSAGRRKAHESTAAAERSLKTAERTASLARETLTAIKKQGDQLAGIDRDLDALHGECGICSLARHIGAEAHARV